MASKRIKTVDLETTRQILKWVNDAKDPDDLADNSIQDDPDFGERDGVGLGKTTANELLSHRAKLADQRFVNLNELLKVKGFGDDKLNDLIFTFSRCRNIYLKIERIDDYNPVKPYDKVGLYQQYERDCMYNPGHENGLIPMLESQGRSVRAIVYREYLDPDYELPKPNKLVFNDINEPPYHHRVPGAVIWARPNTVLRIHVLNCDIEPHSFHLHGFDYGIDSDGAWPFGTQNADGRRSDEICPGQSWVYTFHIKPGMEGAWPFHDHWRMASQSIERGLFGGVIVLDKDEEEPYPIWLWPRPYIELYERVIKNQITFGKSLITPQDRYDLINRKELIDEWLHKELARPERDLEKLDDLEAIQPGEFLEPPQAILDIKQIKPIGPIIRYPKKIHVPLFFHKMKAHDAIPLFNSGDLGEGQVFAHTFNDAGTFDYICEYHFPPMSGTVEVVSGAPANVEVNIVDMAFEPATVQVDVNGTVTWTNQSLVNHHTVTSSDGSAIASHCLNGRAFVGNSPTIVGQSGKTIKWYIFNLDVGHEWHNFHPHASRWRFAQDNVDVRSLGPSESFVIETKVPNVFLPCKGIKLTPTKPAKNARKYRLKGDFVFHCHVHHHMMNGMIGLIRAKQSVWLTAEQKEQVEQSTGLALDPNNNECPQFEADRCDKLGEGEWQDQDVAGVIMMHSVLLPDSSRVLFWGTTRSDQTRIYDPDTGNIYPPTVQPADLPGHDADSSDLWSSEHEVFDTPGGTFVLAHGGFAGSVSIYGEHSFLFDVATETWSETGSSAGTRFYSTTVLLGDGRPLTLYGQTGGNTLEVYDPTTGVWGNFTNIPVSFGYNTYPWTYLLPDGELFVAGPETPTRKFDWTAPVDDPAKTWDNKEGSSRSAGAQNGTSLMLPLKPPYTNPQVVIIGGSKNTGMGAVRLRTAEIIDLGAPTPEWNFIADMNYERGQSNSVLLPDGRIWVAGGIPGVFGIDDGGPCEIYDPENPSDGWVIGPTMNHPRNYHSSAILLADGSVLMGGDNGGANFPLERYYPGYWFYPDRPDITNAPATTSYGATIDIDSPHAAQITTVRLMRPGAVTHSFNMSQRAVDCVINSNVGGKVNITLPANSNVAPPGPYLIFLVTANRVPSIGRWIRLA